MKIIDCEIGGLRIIEPNIFQDKRGKFIKTFNNDFFLNNGLDIEIKETYYSLSNKNVIRGMHFQTPPYDHIKLVYVPYGEIIDVVLDIRKNSPTYGKVFSTKLSAENGKILVIPKGFAHGFKSLENNTNVTYMQTTCYSPECDNGIKYDSIEFDWNNDNFELSERDSLLKSFSDFDTPFIFGVNS